MLTTIIHLPSNSIDDSIFQYPSLVRVNAQLYHIYLKKDDKVLATINVDTRGKKLVIEYSSDHLLEEYKVIHNVISYFKARTEGEIDDSKSFLGYLANGEEAFIITNWKPWLTYIEDSMQNCK